ncbi:MAG: helix-turn-helix domain-containing protein [Alphaproteobacteria bacterium]|nr:helix-turn-helix domain-containing protein [Alphaproteobacteria bacterium]
MSVYSDGYLPDCLLSADPSVILDAQYDDFDEQSQRLVGHDQTYLQLTPGAFSGRFLSCFLGPDVSVHIEHCNQALEQCVSAHPDAYTIGAVINQTDPFRSNGQAFSTADLMVLPPRGSLHLQSPVNGTVLAVVVQQDRLLHNAGMSARAAEWLIDAGQNIRVLHAPQLTRRIREDVIQAIQNASFENEMTDTVSMIGDALLASMAAKLSLELGNSADHKEPAGQSSYERFMKCRGSIYQAWDTIENMEGLLSRTGIKRRSLHQLFKSQIALGPLTYHRVLRLHLARRALSDPGQAGLSIGDIAAAHGFWNWSQFTQQYQNQFGELPSQTRLTEQ